MVISSFRLLTASLLQAMWVRYKRIFGKTKRFFVSRIEQTVKEDSVERLFEENDVRQKV